MKRVYLVRHGQTARSATGSYSGQRDVPLTEEGERQARAAGERLREAGVDAIYTSPLIRATVTADAIAEATGAPVKVEPRLIEVDYGPLEGYNRESASEHFGDVFQAWRDDPFNAHLDGMEPLDDALARAHEATADALEESERPVLVGHQGILRLVMMSLGEVERDDYFSIRLTEAEPVEVSVDGSKLR